jgi:hypothetical protein
VDNYDSDVAKGYIAVEYLPVHEALSANFLIESDSEFYPHLHADFVGIGICTRVENVPSPPELSSVKWTYSGEYNRFDPDLGKIYDMFPSISNFYKVSEIFSLNNHIAYNNIYVNVIRSPHQNIRITRMILFCGMVLALNLAISLVLLVLAISSLS